MPRLYIPAARLTFDDVELLDDESAYLARVLRLRSGDAVEVFDGEGGVHSAVFRTVDRLAVGPRRAVSTPRRFTFELWQGLAKGDKLELVIQKATELGVSRVVPFRGDRSVLKLLEPRQSERLARWRKVAQEAARQCGRADVPEVKAPAQLDALWEGQASLCAAMLHPHASDLSLSDWLRERARGTHVALAVGPEGGFSTDEAARARDAGVALVGLGPLVLRTETAAIVACTLAEEISGGFGFGPAGG